MKRQILMGLMLMIISVSLAVVFQVGEGNYGQGHIPFYSMLDYGWSKCVYSTDELIAAGMDTPININAISYRVGSYPTNFIMLNQKAFIRLTDIDTYDMDYGHPDSDDFMQFMEADLTFQGGGWYIYEFDEPLYWDGYSSIEILWENRNGSHTPGQPTFMATRTPQYQAVYQAADSNFPALPGQPTLDRPNIKFHGEIIYPDDPTLHISPNSLNLGTVLYGETSGPQYIRAMNFGHGLLNLSSANISITGTHAGIFSYSDAALPASLGQGEYIDIPVYLNGGIAGNVSANMVFEYDGDTTTIPLSGIVLSDGVIQIGFGIADQRLPINPYYNYSYSQTIFMQDEIDVEHKQIEKLSYYWHGIIEASNSIDWTIYMGHTDKESFSGSMDWIAFDELTEVFSGNVYMTTQPGWIEIELDTAFIYNNIDNLVIAVHENTEGREENVNAFRTTQVATHRSLIYQSHVSDTQVSYPSDGLRVLGIPNTRITFADPFPVPTLAVHPQEIKFGGVSYDTVSDAKYLTVRNMGLGVLNLGSGDVSITGAHAAAFSIVNDVFPINLITGETAQIPIYIHSATEGNNNANLVINYAGEDHIIPLSAYIVAEEILPAELGFGTRISNHSDYPSPYATQYRSQREQYLIRANELSIRGASAGNIESIAFQVAALNNLRQMTNYRIRIKHTSQTYLGTTPEAGEYTEVYQSDTFMPVLGINEHLFHTLFVWNGTSNIIVEVVTDKSVRPAGANASIYFTVMNFESTLSMYSNEQYGLDSDSGHVSRSRPNLILGVTHAGVPDLYVMNIAGDYTPIAGQFSSYSVRVKNLSLEPVSDYTVKLMKYPDVELTSVAGIPLMPREEAEIAITWQADEVGAINIFGRAEMAGDANALNDESPTKLVTVVESNLFTIKIGEEAGLNNTLGYPAPYGTWYRAFREQYLFRANEIIEMGGDSGIINAIAFHVEDKGVCQSMPNYRIRLKHTQLEGLTTSFEAGEYTQVFQVDNYLPDNGWNVHSFDNPFFWNGTDNLIVEVVTGLMVGGTTGNAHVYHTATEFGSCLRFQSDNGAGDTGSTGSVVRRRANTRLFMVSESTGTLSGSVHEGDYPVANASVSISGTAFNATTDAAGNFTISSLPVGQHLVSVNKHGFTPVSEQVFILEDQVTTVEFEIVGHPEISIEPMQYNFGSVAVDTTVDKTITIRNLGGGTLGISSIELSGSSYFRIDNYPDLPATLRSEESIRIPVSFMPESLGAREASITITDDLPDRAVHTVELRGMGTNSIHIGAGTQEAHLPMNFYSVTSLFETIYTANELDNFIGYITGIKFYNNFSDDLLAKPTKIWFGRTDEETLASGWISADDLDPVFDGLVDYPAGENVINIELDEPYLFAEQGNLVMLVYRPTDTGYFAIDNYFKVQTVGNRRSRMISETFYELDPSDISGGDISGIFPKTTIEMIPGGVGHVRGIVSDSSGTPLEGVLVSIDERNAMHSASDGSFFFQNLSPGDYALFFSKYAYQDHFEPISIEENQMLEVEISMLDVPLITVFGRVLASDTEEGIEGAFITLSGYAEYIAETDAEGQFILDSEVFGLNHYSYVISASGFTSHTGTVWVGENGLDMEDTILYESAYVPTQATAEINTTQSAVIISWNPPDPNAFEIIESFEREEFPPADWSQIITNAAAPNPQGVRYTWSRFGSFTNIDPSDGDYQAGLRWVVEHQDEWLITPGFTCPQDAFLRFDTYLQMGSDGGDHYYVKLSSDGGTTWQVLWDGAQEPDALNSYDTPVVIDLSQYDEQMIKLAWHADDGADGMGMWFNWFIDNVYIGNFGEDRALGGQRLALHSDKATQRSLEGYRVWRLIQDQEENEDSWQLITDEDTTETQFIDEAWIDLASGRYLWAIKAVYSADVISMPVFTNVLHKQSVAGNISGFVRRSDDNQPIAGVLISAGDEHETLSNASGFYNISLPAGSYTVSASHEDYHVTLQEGVVVVPNENTTLNFTLTPTSSEDLVEALVTRLKTNYPNPFNPETTISYDLKDTADVRLDVFNLKGQLVRTLVDAKQAPGSYSLVFSATDEKGNKLSSGIYFYRLKAGSYSKTNKMMLME